MTPAPHEALRARTLYRFFRAGEEETLALQGVSVSVEPGELVAVTGPSEVSSYQPFEAQKYPARALPPGDADFPNPPITRRWLS